MSAQSIMQTCAELGIKLALKGGDSDRLLVDAPKGALTTPIREALAAHKTEIVAALKMKKVSPQSLPQTLSQDSGETLTRTPASNTPHSPEARPLILDRPLTNPPAQLDRTGVEVNKLLSGSDYDANIIGSGDPAARQIVSAQLLAALVGRNSAQQNRARQAFMNHGFFNDTTMQLRAADSPAERAAAARKLGAVGNQEATAHLIASLDDSAPEVRRAAVESLGQLADPSAIAPLNELLLRETSRQLPTAVIRHAINSIAVNEIKHPSASETWSPEPATPTVAASQEAKLEVKTGAPAPVAKREIFADYLNSFEHRPPLAGSVVTSTPQVLPASGANTFDAAEEQLRQEEEALRQAADALERKRSEAAAARRLAEDEVRLKADSEAQIRREIEARLRAEDQVRRRLAEEAARKMAEEEARVRAELADRQRAEEEILVRAEEEVRFRLEAETLRKAAEELARKRSAAEAARKLAEAEVAEQARLRAEEATRVQAAVEARRQAEADMHRRVEDEMRRRAEEEVRRQAEAAAVARAAEEARMRAEVEAFIRAEEERAREESEERHRTEEARLRVEQETLKQVAAELARRRSELEAARQRAEVEAELLSEAEARAKAEQESRQLEAERRRLEAEARRRAEEEQLEEARRRAAEERQQVAERARRLAEEETQRLAELESVKTQAEEVARRLAEQEQRIKAEILALSEAEAEQRLRIEAEIKRRSEAAARLEQQTAVAEAEAQRVAEEIRLKAEELARRRQEAEARLKEEEARLQAEAEARAKVEAEARRLGEELRLQVEAEARRRAETEAHLKEEEARLQTEQEARARAEEEAARRRRAEAEARLIEAEARLQAEHEASTRAEEEAQRLAEETRQKAEAEARHRAEAEARLQAEQAHLLSSEEDLTEAFAAPSQNDASGPDNSSPELSWVDSSSDQQHEDARSVVGPSADEALSIEGNSLASAVNERPKGIEAVFSEKGIVSAEDEGGIPSEILQRLKSADAGEREAALAEVVRVGGDDAFRCLSRAFDDEAIQVRNAAARALFDLQPDRAATFTRALREGTPERRRSIGHALAGSGLAKDAIGNLTGESREKTYDAFSLLFLMAKAGEVQPLMQAIEDYPNVEVRIAVVKLLALSGQPDIIPAFRRMAVRGSLPSEVRSAIMEAIYQIGSQARESAPSAA